MKKLISIFTLVILALTLSSCGTPSLPEGFDSDEVTSAAKSTIEVINTKDYDAICNLLREDLQPLVTPEDLETSWGPMLENAGEFVDYKEIVLTGVEEDDEVYATAVVQCEYEEDDLIYTLSFDENIELAGLYLK